MEKTTRLRLRAAYTAPFIEIYECDSLSPLAGSKDLSGNAGDGDDNGEVNGAKEFDFAEDDETWGDLWDY